MHNPSQIRAIDKICSGRKINLPQDAGIYAFRWLGDHGSILTQNVEPE
tara:strand:+ start:533 stop:676 length:144 start_codon:yes stop_codon:yes gene_type:complete